MLSIGQSKQIKSDCLWRKRERSRIVFTRSVPLARPSCESAENSRDEQMSDFIPTGQFLGRYLLTKAATICHPTSLTVSSDRYC